MARGVGLAAVFGRGAGGVFRRGTGRSRQRVIAVAAVVAVGAGVGVYAVTRSSDRSARVAFALGGGTSASTAGRGTDLAVTGRVAGLTSDRSGGVVLFTATGDDPASYRMWKLTPSGSVTSVPVPALNHEQNLAQVAAAPDGSVYVAADGLWRVTADGRATETVRNAKSASPADDVPVEDFTPFQVEGVTVAADGTVYVSDLSVKLNGLRIHRLSGGRAVRVAGAPYVEGTSQWHPETFDPGRGVPATSTWIPWGYLSGPIAWSKDGLYVRTKQAVLRLSDGGRLLPVVAQHTADRLNRPSGPFRSYGSAIDGYLGPLTGDSDHPPADLAVDPADGAVFYGAGPDYIPASAAERDKGVSGRHAVSHAFTWHGKFTAAQRSFVAGLTDDETVYRAVPGGSVSAVLVQSRAAALAGDHLYVAEQACLKDLSPCTDRYTRTAVVRMPLPSGDH